MNGLPGMPGVPGGMPGGSLPSPPQGPMQNAMQAPAPGQIPGQILGQMGQSQPAVHICFSGVLTCSGCFPCDECAQVVKANVLVMALMEEQRILAIDLPLALQQGRPVNLQLLAETFFRTVANAYRQLHTAMLSEPPERRPFRIANVSAILEAAEGYRALVIARAQQEQAAAAQAAAQVQQTQAQQTQAPNVQGSNVEPAVTSPRPSPVRVPPSVSSNQVPSATSASPNTSGLFPQTPVDFNKALEIKGDVITVHAEEAPSERTRAEEPVAASPATIASSATPSGPAVTNPLTAEDFKRAAPRPPANGSQTS